MSRTRSSIIAALAIAVLVIAAVGSVSPAIAQEDGAGAVEFNGKIAGGSQITGGETRSLDGLQEQRGVGWTFATVEMSDPRLQGTVIHTHNIDSYSGVKVFSSTWRIENERGAWQGSEHSVTLPSSGDRTSSSVVLVGEGDYAGFTALVEVDFVGFDKYLRGVILQHPLPPTPESAVLTR